MTPEQAYDILENDHNHKDRESLEHTIGSDARESYHYAEYVIKGRFELGEAAISESAVRSYWYARDVIKERFELGEAAISQKARWSQLYARDVIGGRWELGEAAISKDADTSFKYAKEVIGGRLPDTMHRKMLAFGIMDSSDKHVKRYLDYIGSKKYCTLKRKDTKNESKLGI